MSKQGVDIAWARPTVAQIKAVGAKFVLRYFSHDAKKNLTKADVTSYHAGGLETGVVWETTAGRALAGKAAGIADAKEAETQRKAVGLPSDMVIHFAVDTDTTWAKVQDYFDGAISVLGIKRVGAYGGVKIIDGAYGHGIRYLWQTIAWSGGVQSKHATIYQHGGTTLGGGADWDTALVADYGQYPRPAAPAPKPAPAPAPKPKYEPYPGLAFFKAGKKSPIIAAMHKRLVAVGCNHYKSSTNPDVWGSGDVASYKAWQLKCAGGKGTHTGIPGKGTWDKLQVPNV